MIGTSLALVPAMAATPPLVRGMPAAYAVFALVTALMAARASPFQALLAEIVPDEERGSLMSLSMAAGQGGAGVGGVLAGSSYALYGYPANAGLAAVSVLAIAFLVWRWLPETVGARKTSGA